MVWWREGKRGTDVREREKALEERERDDGEKAGEGEGTGERESWGRMGDRAEVVGEVDRD